MKTLKLKHCTFLRTFGPDSKDSLLHLSDRILSEGPDPIRYVQPIDGILKNYDKVEVTKTEIVGHGDWGRIVIEVIITYDIREYDDLSLHLVPEKVMVPRVEQTQTPPQ